MTHWGIVPCRATDSHVAAVACKFWGQGWGVPLTGSSGRAITPTTQPAEFMNGRKRSHFPAIPVTVLATNFILSKTFFFVCVGSHMQRLISSYPSRPGFEIFGTLLSLKKKKKKGNLQSGGSGDLSDCEARQDGGTVEHRPRKLHPNIPLVSIQTRRAW